MPRVLVLSPVATHPQDAGNRARIHRFVQELVRQGHEVDFAFVRMEPADSRAMAEAWPRYFEIPASRRTLRLALGRLNAALSLLPGKPAIPFPLDSWYPPELDAWLDQHLRDHEYDVVIVNYVMLSRALERFPASTLKLLDTHDVFGGRHHLFRSRGVKASWYFVTVGAEARGLRRADAVLAIQEREAEHFRALVPGTTVLTVGHPVEAVPPNTIESPDPSILFIGSPNLANYTSLARFIDEVLPPLRRLHPELRLRVVGGVADRFERAPEGVDLVGRVAELGECYGSAWVVVNVMDFGTGLKIKTVEALAHGRPLVTTPVGAAGLEEGAGEAFLVAADAEGFVAAIDRLLRDETRRRRLAAAARDFASRYNGRVYEELHGFLAERVPRSSSPTVTDESVSP